MLKTIFQYEKIIIKIYFNYVINKIFTFLKIHDNKFPFFRILEIFFISKLICQNYKSLGKI